jgi:hypothetical protein
MAILSSLKFVTVTRSSRLNEVEKRRLKLSDRLEDQIDCVKSKLNNQFFTKSKQVWRANESGADELVAVSRVIKPWWWTDLRGQIFFPLKYGTQPIEFVKGKSVFQVDNLEELLKSLIELKRAVLEGELDVQLTIVARASGTKLKD